jgi:large subunit ribosomal protein L40
MLSSLQGSVRTAVVRTTGALIGSSSQGLHTSCVMFAEPLKKKKRLDPIVLKMRVDRKVRKIEKAIRQLENAEKVLKPLMERTLAPQVYRELELRTRDEDQLEQLKERADKLFQLWSLYRKDVSDQQIRSIRQVTLAQQRVLTELQAEWPELHQHALSIDEQLLPYEETRLITDSPPNPAYIPPDGTRTTVTKQWMM